MLKIFSIIRITVKRKSILFSMALASLLQAEQITSIEYVNLTKISTSIANDTLGVRIGEELDPNKVNKAIKEFYKYNYFDDITASIDNGKLKILFKEKPSIANVDITGYKQREDDIEVLKNQIGIKKGRMYSTKLIKDSKEALLKELEKEGYINSVVEVDIENLSEDAVSVTFNVNKGDEIVIKKVNYFGSKNLESSQFEKVTANKEQEMLSWLPIFNDGELKAEELQYDSRRIQELYFENGYLDAKVQNPFLEVDFASNQADLDFYIDEGIQYKTNSITIYLNQEILDPKDIYPELKLKKDKVFNVKMLRRDANYIKNMVADRGYAFTQVNYDIKKDEKNGTADIIFNVIPGDVVSIRDVKISGNSRTLDRVIRRNVYLAPGDLYNQTDYNDSINKLRRSGFFEDVSIEQKRVSADTMDIIVKVKEAPTGNIILGGGYGSYDGFMLSGSLNEKNLFGSGIGFSFSGDISEKTQDFSINLSNPSIRDSKYSGQIEIHADSTEINNDVYDLDKQSNGFSVTVGREIIRNLRAGLTYRFDSITEDYTYEDGFVFDPTKKYYEDQEYTTSSLTPYFSFDNTNDYYNPTEGFKLGSSLEYAGLGGDSKYIKSSSYLKTFYSLEDKFDLNWIFRYKLQAKILIDNGQINQGDSLYLGGTKSLRGYKSYAFGPNNDDGIIEDPYKMMAANSFEVSFPLIEDMKMRWGLFYDYGMIGQDGFDDIQRSSTGALFEWVSPFGPLTLIFAQPIDNEDTDDISNFEFSLGSTF
ncbi:outer membrane protein assembly factor BamA [Arcobacter arenosus]|uniref:Outer membrane protein assembly factor BamA n=1 Tax=Arcobacter arenosus TaxID=2576037 RepID=A0A5R8XXW6_9BACT|nr:outer membrane protein assembly factor BamA [Arcobacter arenosus]